MLFVAETKLMVFHAGVRRGNYRIVVILECTETNMPISEFLLPELDEEMKKTRTTLERVPADKKEFAPHAKSMPMGKLAPHIAQLAGFGLTILTTPELDFSKGSIRPLPFESAAQLVQAFDEGAAKVRT